MTPERMLRAAEVLRDEADALQLSHGIRSGDDFVWADDDECDRSARKAHDEMIALASELEEHAHAVASAPPWWTVFKAWKWPTRWRCHRGVWACARENREGVMYDVAEGRGQANG